MLFENWYEAILLGIEAKLQSKNWILRLTLCLFLLSIFLAFPSYNVLFDHIHNHSEQMDAWTFIRNQAENLLNPSDIGYGVYTRRNAMIYRWTLPLLYKFTGQNIIVILVLQALTGIAFLYLIARRAYAILQDKISTCLFALSASQIFVGAWPFVDIYGYGDSFAFFFLLVLMFTRNPLGIFLLLMAAFFTDERAVIAGGYVLLWWIVTKCYQQNNFQLKNILSNAFLGSGWIVWAAWIFYFAIRTYVGHTYFPDHRYTYNWEPVLLKDSNRYGFGSSIWSVFEGLWLVIIASVLALWLTKRYALMLALTIGFVVLLTTSIYVHDIDRALSYGFPFFLIALFILSKTASLQSTRLILFFSAVICVIHPFLLTMGFNKVVWIEPFPVRVIMTLDRLWDWNLFN